MFSISTAILSMTLGASALHFSAATVPTETSLKDWRPRMGDHFMVDLQTNEGYLIHPDMTYTRFPVITGQKRFVHYLGRTYDATTPAIEWVAKSSHIQPDRITFGPTGRFLRLYENGEEYTQYGIHEHAAETMMFDRAIRYQSMGCIIVKTAILDIIEKTYNLNEGSLRVATINGVRGFPVAMSVE